MTSPALARYAAELDAIREQGLFKAERVITGPQSAEITLADGSTVLNFCANNYLGLADHADIIQAAVDNWTLPADTDYTLVNTTTGRALVPGEDLAKAARPGDVLEVQPVLVAG